MSAAPKKTARSRRPPRVKDTVRASQAVASALANRGLTDQIRANRLIAEWAELVGPRIATRTRPGDVVDRTLYVEVASSAWMHELNLLRTQIVENLLARIGEPRLFDDIKFKLAGRSRRTPTTIPARRRPAPPPRPRPVPATGAAREAIVREVGAVDDDELRELIARVRISNGR